MADHYRDRPFPADDSGRENLRMAAQPPADSDPLAELARLIGQADPFSTFGREQQARSARHPQREAEQPDPYAAAEAIYSAGHSYPPEEPSFGGDASYDPEPSYAQEPSYAPEPSPPYVPGAYAGDEEEIPASRPSWMQNLAARHAQQELSRQDDRLGRDDRFDVPQFQDDPRDPGFAPRAPHFDHSGYDPLPQATADHGQQADGSDRYDDVLYGDGGQGRQVVPRAYGADDGAYEDGYGDAPYDDGYAQEQDGEKPRRGGTMTVIVVLLLAVVGTGAAFAYRTFVGSPRSGEPPVIKADTSPNKVILPGSGDTSGKQITDRVGDKNTERMVSREEQPVDVNARTAGPRVVFPPLTQNANPPTVTSASPAARPIGAGVGNGTLSGGEEPRKIRTLSIRPDQADAVPSVPVQAATTPAAPRMATPQAPAPRAAAPVSTASTGASQAGGPVSLSPQAVPAETRSRVAAVNPSVGTGGGAYVQVSSQKSEADARASFRALQGKYAGILGSRTASIHRVDIAGKGVFYRAMVGPFASGDEAVQLCTSLKSAGGQCVIQRN